MSTAQEHNPEYTGTGVNEVKICHPKRKNNIWN